MKTNKGTTTIEDLSDDLTVKILRLLPFKTSVLCLGVCKRWRSLVSKGPFSLTDTINIAYFPSPNFYFCLQSGQRRRMQKSGFCFSFKWLARSPYTPKMYDDYEYRTLASCNGLLLWCFPRTTIKWSAWVLHLQSMDQTRPESMLLFRNQSTGDKIL